MKNVLLTGINGFLGSNIAKRLSVRYNVIGIEYSTDDLFRLNGYNFEVYKSDKENITHIFDRHSIDIIIHTATFYGRSNEDFNQIVETNLLMPFYLLNAAIKAGVTAFINTDTVLDRFSSTYALTKRQFQEWLYARSAYIKAINLQLEHFYGPGCPSTNFITAMTSRMNNGEAVIDLTEGKQKRDFIYYTDVVDAFELVIEKLDILEASYSTFEVCSGELITIREILEHIKGLTNSVSKLNFGAIPYRENELMVSKTNNKNLLNIGWVPKVNIAEGLKKTVQSV